MKLISGLLALVMIPSVSFANDYLNEGLYVGNQNPFRGIFNIPRHRPNSELSAGAYRSSFQLEIHNSFTGVDVGNESIFIDGETYVGRLAVERGFSDGWRAGFELPIVSHQGGFLDSIIDDWHDAFSLDGFDRGDAPEDLLLYRYIDGESLDISVREKNTDIGDLVLTMGKRWENSGGSSLFRIEVKLPTGDAESLMGSGGVDVGVRVQTTRKISRRGTLYGGLGFAWLETGDVLAELRQNWAGTFTLGWSWQQWSRVALKVQLDGQTSPYKDTEIQQLGDESMQLSFGASFLLSDKSVVDIGVIEDEWKVNVSPDFGVLVRYQRY